MPRLKPSVAACVLAAAYGVLAQPSVQLPSANITGAALTYPGVAGATTANAYLGIPFATPPQRFMPPVAQQLSGDVDATQWKASCMQQGAPLKQFGGNETSFFSAYNATQSEDCLFLNIFTPAEACEPLPVLFSIHGGNLQTGSGSLAVFNGVPIAATKDVIVVTINYRVGVFGFVQSPELKTDEKNPGFLDQRMALAWVYENIAAFGGDPNAITIAGQSAGGYSVKQLLLNPPEPLPFRAAIMESQTLLAPIDSWPALVGLTNCTTAPSQLACVQAVDASLIAELSAKNMLYFPPAIENVTNSAHAELAIATSPHIPILTGTNGNEVAQFFPDVNPAMASALWTAVTGGRGPSFEQLYNSSLQSLDPYQAVRRPLNQYAYTCRAKILSERAAQTGHPTWRYFFNATFANVDIAYPGENAHGASHGAELPLIFGTFPSQGSDEDQVRLGKHMQDTFIGFVKDPESSLRWPQVGGSEPYLLFVDNKSGPVDTVVGNEVADFDCGPYEALLLMTGEV
ncbi:unnamed protein product [Zymoseptoria tritici ST99CH_1E4]|uniref:Carboxylic ester hydrolase n=1 Tax=Zymoseptoria tritici ST99CH_1E4 TaxID=1276532 RepID=A0A2H1GNI8_ZYMTR|nr:unnamed protein product [Zymoseptoria tritici ST99CH_1E4]